MLDWDDIKITVIDEAYVVTEDEEIYSLKAEQRMIIYEGEPGATGPKGDDGEAATLEFTAVDTLPAGSNAYAENLGDEHHAVIKLGIPRGQNGAGAVWGDIDGTLANQVDLQSALDTKANLSALGALATKDNVDYNTAEVINKPTLGTMSAVNDAPSDGDEYVRKNGAWAVSSGITGVAWGDITGTLADQTDLQTALDVKAPLASPALTGTPTAPTASSGTNTTQIATTAFVKTELAKEILYFYQQSTSATSAASAEFCRISDSRITADTVVLNCEFTVPSAITSDVSWESASGYISLKGICTSTNCKVNVVLGQKGN